MDYRIGAALLRHVDTTSSAVILRIS
jgi:hypothetical protein